MTLRIFVETWRDGVILSVRAPNINEHRFMVADDGTVTLVEDTYTDGEISGEKQSPANLASWLRSLAKRDAERAEKREAS